VPFFARAVQTLVDCQAISTVLPANLVGPIRAGARGRSRSDCRRVTAVEDGVLAQGGPGNPGKLVGERDDHKIAVDATIDHRSEPVTERRVAAGKRRQCSPRSMYEQRSQIGVAALGDPEQPRSAAGGMLPGYQSQPGAKVACLCKVPGVTDGC